LYKIKGIAHTGIYDLDVDTVFMSKTELNHHLGLGDKASIILVKLNDKDLAGEKKQVLMDELGVFKIKTWVEEIEHIMKSMGAWTNFSNMVISVGLIESAISVGVIIFINVVHKRRQISIMKTIGASNSFVFIVFIIEAGLFAVLGVAGGDFWDITQQNILKPIPSGNWGMTDRIMNITLEELLSQIRNPKISKVLRQVDLIISLEGKKWLIAQSIRNLEFTL